VGPFETIALIAVAFAATKILGPIGVAIGDRVRGLRREGVPTDMLADEMDALRERVRQLEQVQPRMAELEERVDFAERLLAQPALPARVGSPDEGSVR
jgi:hypothetical protein